MVKRPILVLTVGLILLIAGAHYLEIGICSPFNLEKIYSTVSECKIVGVIVEEQKESEYYYKYVLKVEKLYCGNKSIPQLKNSKILLKIKKGKSNIEDNSLIVGNEILIDTEIQLPSGARNYGGYDYKLYLKTLGIYAIAETEISSIKIVQYKKFSLIDEFIYKTKNKIISNLNEILSSDVQGLAIGILLGDSKFISDDIKQNFKQSNLSHILAVSGAHVSYIIIGLTKCLKKVDKRVQKITLIVFLLFFIKLTGATSSVTRAGIMGILVLVAQICKRKSDVLNNISISCFIILLINPYSLFNLGFQLSYAGTLGIILFYDILYGIVEKVHKKININCNIKLLNMVSDKLINYVLTTLTVSISANILIMPIMIYKFNNFSLIFLISNLLVSGLFGIIMFLGFLIIIISFLSINIAGLLSPLLELFLNLLVLGSKISNSLNFLNITVPTPKLVELIFIYLLIFIIRQMYLNNKKLYKKILLIAVLIYFTCTIFSCIFSFLNPSMKIHFVDVGQGDCSLIITQQNKKILIDGGGSNTGFDVGEQILLPYLLDRKILELDFVLISHFDSDHCKGAFTVLENMKVKNVCVSKKGQESENYEFFLEIVKNRKLNVIYVQPGDILTIDKFTKLEILWTGSNEITDNIINNYSITCKLIYNNVKVLFTGDIEALAEKKIANIYNLQQLNCDILKVAHHGSKTSSIDEILNKIKPKIALIGVGVNNNFGHPNKDVINRLMQLRSTNK